mmetsp:Transcript_53612/g.116871  ORF Transcript_53612/g.116871 Transcript_53612/m.116871 type:complete len:219 (+) Transcript_53612:193-849(+)
MGVVQEPRVKLAAVPAGWPPTVDESQETQTKGLSIPKFRLSLSELRGQSASAEQQQGTDAASRTTNGVPPFSLSSNKLGKLPMFRPTRAPTYTAPSVPSNMVPRRAASTPIPQGWPPGSRFASPRPNDNMHATVLSRGESTPAYASPDDLPPMPDFERISSYSHMTSSPRASILSPRGAGWGEDSWVGGLNLARGAGNPPKPAQATGEAGTQRIGPAA